MIVGISGKKNHGKDTVANIIMLLDQDQRSQKMDKAPITDQELVVQLLSYERGELGVSTSWEVHRFADTLKDMVCRLLDCTREKLEDREFKEKPIEGWNVFRLDSTYTDETMDSEHCEMYEESDLWGSMEEAIAEGKRNKKIYHVPEDSKRHGHSGDYEYYIEEIQLTPRLILQLLGTDGMRNVIHPNIHVLALMRKYNPTELYSTVNEGGVNYIDSPSYPNWLVPDVRFPNEGTTIKDVDGILIRINNGSESTDKHPSETGMDDWKDWDAEIDNTGSLLQLVGLVRDIYNNIIIA